MDMNSIRTVSVLKSMTIVLSMFGSMQTKKLTLMKSKAAKKSVNVVTRVTTLTVTTNVSNSQKTAKRLTNTENVLNAAKVSSSRVTNVLLTIIVKNTDGLMLETNGTVLKLKAVKKVCKCCEKGYYLDCDYKCVKLPDYCEKANKYGECTECCKGYKLIEGVCKVDDHCEEYGWLDAGKKWQKTYVKGCLKVCKCCEKGFYLDCDNKCQPLPCHCEEAYTDGSCKCCEKGYELCDGKCVEKKKDNRRY